MNKSNIPICALATLLVGLTAIVLMLAAGAGFDTTVRVTFAVCALTACVLTWALKKDGEQ